MLELRREISQKHRKIRELEREMEKKKGVKLKGSYRGREESFKFKKPKKNKSVLFERRTLRFKTRWLSYLYYYYSSFTIYPRHQMAFFGLLHAPLVSLTTDSKK